MIIYYLCMFELYLFLFSELVADICNFIVRHKESDFALSLKYLCTYIEALMLIVIIITEIILFGVLIISCF